MSCWSNSEIQQVEKQDVMDFLNKTTLDNITEFSNFFSITHTTLCYDKKLFITNYFIKNPKDLVEVNSILSKLDSSFICKLSNNSLLFRIDYYWCDLSLVTGNLALFMYLFCLSKTTLDNKKLICVINDSCIELINCISKIFKNAYFYKIVK